MKKKLFAFALINFENGNYTNYKSRQYFRFTEEKYKQNNIEKKPGQTARHLKVGL